MNTHEAPVNFLTDSMEYWGNAVNRATTVGLGRLVDSHRPERWANWRTYYDAADTLNAAIEKELLAEAERNTADLREVRRYVVSCMQQASQKELDLLNGIVKVIDDITETVEKEALEGHPPTEFELANKEYDAGIEDYEHTPDNR